MVRKNLKKKPLVEAIFELKWELQEQKNKIKIDPHYKILIGRVYDRVKDDYPFYEQLSTATMPDEIAGYIVQHRFRKDKDEWPLIQIGPGIITLNETEKYFWKDFRKRISNLLEILFDAYPDAKNNLKVNGLLLRYIDAIAFDYGKNNIFLFLKEKMKINIGVYKKLFENTRVNKSPLGLDLRFVFPSNKPSGSVHLRFARGGKEDTDVLIWETIVQSASNDVPKSKNKIITWVNKAHNLTDDWFFKIIEGELQRRFE